RSSGSRGTPECSGSQGTPRSRECINPPPQGSPARDRCAIRQITDFPVLRRGCNSCSHSRDYFRLLLCYRREHNPRCCCKSSTDQRSLNRTGKFLLLPSARRGETAMRKLLLLILLCVSSLAWAEVQENNAPAITIYNQNFFVARERL